MRPSFQHQGVPCPDFSVQSSWRSSLQLAVQRKVPVAALKKASEHSLPIPMHGSPGIHKPGLKNLKSLGSQGAHASHFISFPV